MTAPTSTARPIGTLLVINCLSSKMPPDFGTADIQKAAAKLDRPVDSGGALSYSVLRPDEHSLRDTLRIDLQRMRQHPDPTIIILGDFSPEEWDELTVGFPGVEFCNLTSQDLED